MSFTPEPDEPVLREVEDREAETDDKRPVLWALLGVVLIGVFVIALQAHWFGLNAVASVIARSR